MFLFSRSTLSSKLLRQLEARMLTQSFACSKLNLAFCTCSCSESITSQSWLTFYLSSAFSSSTSLLLCQEKWMVLESYSFSLFTVRQIYMYSLRSLSCSYSSTLFFSFSYLTTSLSIFLFYCLTQSTVSCSCLVASQQPFSRSLSSSFSSSRVSTVVRISLISIQFSSASSTIFRFTISEVCVSTCSSNMRLINQFFCSLCSSSHRMS